MNSEKTSIKTKVKQRNYKKKRELKKTTQNIKEELSKDMENLRKKNETKILQIKIPFSQTKNTVEGHSRNLNKWKTESQSLKIK
jgi:hypothetical protein